MSIKNILCAYSGETNKGSALRHALKIAKHHDGWITGVIRHGRNKIERLHGGAIPDSVLATLREHDDQHIKEITDRFKSLVNDYGMSDHSEHVDLGDEYGMTLSQFARTFDLIVTGSHAHEADEDHLSANPDLLALQSGRPVLIIPDEYDAPGLSENVVVAWDGKRSSARAIGDAMPILEEKAKVTILTVGNTPAPGAERVMENLIRHGINAQLDVRNRSGSVATTILTAASDLDAKLIVMGAFEHSKFSHDLIGGVTTDVMRDANVPVFMSH